MKMSDRQPSEIPVFAKIGQDYIHFSKAHNQGVAGFGSLRRLRREVKEWFPGFEIVNSDTFRKDGQFLGLLFELEPSR